MATPIMIKVPQFPWYGDTELELEFPASWEVITCTMSGDSTSKLTAAEMKASFANPIGIPRIAELARGKKEVVILFDDLSRPTKVAELVPYVLEELKEGGVSDEGIRFIACLGTHGAMKLMDFIKKLGPEVVQKFPVYNHNPYENCTFLGTTSRGTPVSINNEVMACDLKIAIGGIVPHPSVGFGGGGKSIVPGVAHIDSIWAFHHNVAGLGKPTAENPLGKLDSSGGFGKVEDNVIRLDVEEGARMAGLDVIVNVVINLKRDTVGLFIGNMVAAHREGVKLAEKVYATKKPGKVDVVVANAYGKANEGSVALLNVIKMLDEDGCDLLLICNTPEGQVCHYMLRSFGKNIGGRLWGPRETLPPRIKRMIVLAPYIDRAGVDWLGPPKSVTRANGWHEALKELEKSHGKGTRVAVIPDATIQYFPARSGEEKCSKSKTLLSS